MSLLHPTGEDDSFASANMEVGLRKSIVHIRRLKLLLRVTLRQVPSGVNAALLARIDDALRMDYQSESESDLPGVAETTSESGL